MSDKAKIGAAVAGGYLLGRTKRGRLALGLALLLAGYRPTTQLRRGLLQLADSPEIGQLASQVRGPLGQAGRRAAEALVAAQAVRLTDQLERRTDALTDQLKDAGQAGRDAAERPVRGVRKRARGAGEGTEEEGAEQEKGARPRGRRDEDPDEYRDEERVPRSRDDGDYEDDEADRYDDDEDAEPVRPKATVGSRRRSS